MTAPDFGITAGIPSANGIVRSSDIAPPFLWTENLTLRYGNKPALVDVSLPVARGAITALIGPSGCGKTSFLYCLNRLTDLISGCSVTGQVCIGDLDVLHPKTVIGIHDLDKSLTPENLTRWLASLSTREVKVSLPKFRAESEFSLGKTLSIMGMPTAFTDKADFSGIVSKGGLAISEVVHKAFVEVSEQGTEAAAATGIGIHALAMHMPEPAVVFRADHPFIFVIRDTRSEIILFIGRLMNPR